MGMEDELEDEEDKLNGGNTLEMEEVEGTRVDD